MGGEHIGACSGTVGYQTSDWTNFECDEEISSYTAHPTMGNPKPGDPDGNRTESSEKIELGWGGEVDVGGEVIGYQHYVVGQISKAMTIFPLTLAHHARGNPKRGSS